jgi:hypothetical protein
VAKAVIVACSNFARIRVRVATLFTEDALLVEPHGMFSGRQDIERRYADTFQESPMWLLGVEALDVDGFGVAGDVTELEEHLAHLRDLMASEDTIVIGNDVVIDTHRATVANPVNVVSLRPVIGFLEAVFPKDLADDPGRDGGGIGFFYCGSH